MAQPMAERLNINAAKSMAFLRPRRSLIIPAEATPAIDPIRAQPTYQPSCIVSSPNWEVTIDVVPEITAVSYPNSIPPIAATTERNTTYPKFSFFISILNSRSLIFGLSTFFSQLPNLVKSPRDMETTFPFTAFEREKDLATAVKVSNHSGYSLSLKLSQRYASSFENHSRHFSFPVS